MSPTHIEHFTDNNQPPGHTEKIAPGEVYVVFNRDSYSATYYLINCEADDSATVVYRAHNLADFSNTNNELEIVNPDAVSKHLEIAAGSQESLAVKNWREAVLGKLVIRHTTE